MMQKAKQMINKRKQKEEEEEEQEHLELEEDNDDDDDEDKEGMTTRCKRVEEETKESEW